MTILNVNNSSSYYNVYNVKYVVAGEFNEYINWLDEKGYCYTEYLYVIGPKMLENVFNPTGFFIGSWKDRNDIDEIKELIKKNKSQSTVIQDLSPWSNTNLCDILTIQPHNYDQSNGMTLSNIQLWDTLTIFPVDVDK